MSVVDGPDAWFERDDEPEADPELNLAAARAILASLEGRDELEPSLEAGACDECGEETEARFELGHFALCRLCRRRRAKVAGRLPDQRMPPPLPPPPRVPGQLSRHPHE